MIGALEPHNIHALTPDVDRGRKLSAAIVIPVYNRPELLRNTLHSLLDQAPGSPPFTVHVVDDGSEEDIHGLVTAVGSSEIHYHRQERNGFGAGRARNLGASKSNNDLLVFLDADCVVSSDFVLGHAAWHELDARTVVIGGRANAVQGSPDEFADYRAQLRRRTGDLQFGVEVFRSLVSSNVSMPATLFRSVGGFDERFTRWGGEDTELGWRLWQEGATFINDPDLTVDHQLEEDSSGGAEGRQRARDQNDGLIQSLIPQRFYRRYPPDVLPETPKVEVIAEDIPPGAAAEIWNDLTRQPRTDFALAVVGQADEHEPFAGLSVGDPRIRFVESTEAAIDTSRSEYLCFLNGHGAPGPKLLVEMVKRLDLKPHLVSGTVGYALPPDSGGAVRSRNGAADIDIAWKSETPLCWFVRTREARKGRQAGLDFAAIWHLAREWDLNAHLASAAVRFPGAIRTPRPIGLTHYPPQGRKLVKDVVNDPLHSVGAATRYLKARRTGIKYTPLSEEAKAALRSPGDTKPKARYVGWTGKHNLGDDLMLDAVKDLLSWADVETSGDPADLLLLGGGTLINRNTYLRWILERDSPRVERAVLGTGVASPEFWGITEDTDRWVRWLSSCAYVGVRGPYSRDVLREWGYDGQLEVSGDSALLMEPPTDITKVEGRVVVAPAWTKGELWGQSDQDVIHALSGAVARWIAEGREVLTLASSPEDDGHIIEMARVEEKILAGYVPGYIDRAAGVEAIASADVVVGERLHACVLAAAMGTPFVAIEYRPKLRDFAASVDVEHLVLRTDEVEADQIVSLAKLAEAEGVGASKELVSEYRRRLRAGADRIRHAMSS